MEDEADCVVTIVSGSGLASKDANGKSDPYVKCEVRDASGTVLLKKETPVVKKTLDPLFGYRFFVRLPASARLFFEVWDWDFIGGHDHMGDASVGARELRAAGSLALALGARGRDEVSGSLRVVVVWEWA